MNWEDVKRGIFAGESGGDYNALYGYSNRPGGQFSGTKVTDMTLDEALNFSNPSGAYGQAVKSQIGRVATPMGAYQVVGTTLRDAKKGLGLTGTEKFTPELQDKIGKYIYETQGTGAWAGYKGPKQGGAGDTSMDNSNQPQPRRGLLGGQGIGSALGMSEDFRDKLKIAVLSGSDPAGFAGQISSIQKGMQGRKAEAQASERRNKTAAVLRQQGQGKIADLLEQGLISGTDAAGQLLKAPAEPKTYEFQAVVNDLIAANPNMSRADALSLALGKNKSVTNVQVGADGKPQSTFWKKVDEDFAKEFSQLSSSGLSSAARNAATIQTVLEKMGNTEGMQLSGPGQALLGRMGRALFNPEAENVKGLVGQVVQQSLRETLGGQFAQKEGEALIQRAYDEALPPEKNAARLRALFMQLQSIAETKKSMFEYAKKEGTLEGYEGPRVGTPTREDFFEAMQSVAPTDQSKFEFSGKYNWDSFTKEQADALSEAEIVSMNPADYEAWEKAAGYR